MFKGYLYSLLATLCYALPSVFTVFAFRDGLTPNSLIFYHSLVGTVILFVYMRLLGEKIPKLTRPNQRDFLISSMAKALTGLCVYNAIMHMDVSLVLTLNFMYPAVVLLLEFLIDKKKLSVSQTLGLICTIIGEMLVLKLFQGEFGTLSVIGTLLGAASGLTWGFMIYWTNKTLSTFSTTFVSGYTTAIGTLFYFFILPPTYLLTAKITLPVVSWSLFFGVVNSVLAMVLMFAGMKFIGAARFSIISIFELPLTVMFAFLFLHEHLGLSQILGGVCILLGIVLFDLKNFQSVLSKKSQVA